MTRIALRRALTGGVALVALALPLAECGDSDGCAQAICATPGSDSPSAAAISADTAR